LAEPAAWAPSLVSTYYGIIAIFIALSWAGGSVKVRNVLSP
jgi:hypothetical protein